MNGLSKSEMELLASASASSSTSTTSTSPASPPNTLKFGQKIYFEHVGVVGPQHTKSATGLSSPPVIGTSAPATSKKGRGGGVIQGRQPPRCQVEGCEADLSDVKAYYSRHKVCATHSKSPVVIVAGLEQRFCQQCSRFHRLPEFDQGKRSCRRRLAGHNERRRKPPPGSLLSNRYGSLSSSVFENNGRSGSFLVDFTAYPNLTGGAWPNTRSSERGWDNQSTASGKLLQSHWLNSSENPTSDLVLQGSVARGANYSGPGIIPSGNCFSGVSDSSGALSLLSNESWGSRNQSSSLGVNGLVNTDGGHTVQPSGSHAAPVNHYSGPLWGFKGNEASSSSHAIPPDLGLDHISQHAVNQYSPELGMAQHSGRQYIELEHSKGYDSSVQNVHWTL